MNNMSKVFKIRKGLDISLKGRAEKVLSKTAAVNSYAVKPGDFHHLVPKLVVKEGDAVLAGSPLFVDKYRPDIQYASPVSGTVSAIVRGDKRKLLAVEVSPTPEQAYFQHHPRELNAMYTIRELSGRVSPAELTEQVTDILSKTRDNQEFVQTISSLEPARSENIREKRYSL